MAPSDTGTQSEVPRNLQVTAQVPMLAPAVTLTRSGRLPQSIYIMETGQRGPGKIRRIRACGFE